MQPAAPGTDVLQTETARVRTGRDAQPTTDRPQGPRRLGTPPRPIAGRLNALPRLVANSIGGRTYGADQAFTTYATGPVAGGVSPFGAGVAAPPASTYPDLSGLQPTPPPKATSPAISKALTKTQKLSKALKACRRDKSKSKRAKCEKEARKKYGTKTKKRK
jgi:hypothetical protein